MISTVFDYAEIKESASFGIKKYNDAVYRGQLKDGKRHGSGVMVYRKSRIYEG